VDVAGIALNDHQIRVSVAVMAVLADIPDDQLFTAVDYTESRRQAVL